MTTPFFISDLHLGHKNILKFSAKWRPWCTNIDEHDYTLIERIRSTCRKKTDILYILGDVAFDIDKLELLNDIKCRKILIRGNHDEFPDEVYKKYFESVQGFVRYKKYWLSHCPIHPHELRGRKNIHGHVHSQSILKQGGTGFDENYINVCVEACDGYPVRIQDIQNGWFTGEV